MTYPVDHVYIVFDYRGAIQVCTLDSDKAFKWIEDQVIPSEYFVDELPLMPISD